MSNNYNVNPPQVEKLKGRENYNDWAFAVENVFKLEGLWSIIQPKPNADGSFPAVDAAKDEIALAKIVLLVETTLYPHVRTATSAKDAWEKLRKTYADSGLMRKVGLVERLSIKLCDCESMEDYINEKITASHKLNAIGFTISDEFVGALLLSGLGDDYKPMVIAMESSGITITGDLVKNKLLQDVNSLGSSQSVDGAMFSKQKGKVKKCKYCKLPGHVEAKCFKKQNDSNNRHVAMDAHYVCLNNINKNSQDYDWFIDSGATCHMTRTRSWIQDLKSDSGSIIAANQKSMRVVGCGTVCVYPLNSSVDVVALNNVKYVPDISLNLLSVTQMVQNGFEIKFNSQGAIITNRKGHTVATASLHDQMFKLDHKVIQNKAMLSTFNIWHKRLGHLNDRNIVQLKNGLAKGIEFKESKCSPCIVCAKGKQHRFPFKSSESRSNELLELVHSDVCGPMEVNSMAGSRYFITFIDDKSRQTFVYFLSHKSQVFDAFKSFKAMVEKQTGRKIKTLRDDNGGEYVNNSMKKFLDEEGIIHQTTVPFSPQQNGVSERANRTIMERARCLLFESKLPKSFWAEAVLTSVYIMNRSPHSFINKTPEEIWSGKVPDLSHLRVFGTKAMAFIPDQKRRKLDPKSVETIMVGYAINTKGYRLYDPQTKKIIISRDVVFLDEGHVSNNGNSLSSCKPKNVVTLNFIECNRQSEPSALSQSEPVLETIHDSICVHRGDYESFHEQSDFPPNISSFDDENQINPFVSSPNALPLQINRPADDQELRLRRSDRERQPTGKFQISHKNSDGKPSKSYFSQLPSTSNNIPQDVYEENAEINCTNSTPFNSGDTIALPSQINRSNFTKNSRSRHSDRERHPNGKYCNFSKETCTPVEFSSQNPNPSNSQSNFQLNKTHALLSHKERLSSAKGSKPRCSDLERPNNGKYKSSVPKNVSAAEFCSQDADPISYKQAIQRPNSSLWKVAMQEEIEALESNETWELVDLPPNKKTIRCKWVYKTKLNQDGTIDKHKARLVVKGCSQKPGIDFDEVYSPVVKYTTIRYMMSLAVGKGLKIYQMDAVSAFLQSELKDEEIYMEQPEGFKKGTQVCKLKKALYGLKQASRVWNNKLDQKLREFGLIASDMDPCLYYYVNGDEVAYITIWVDDLLIFSNNIDFVNRFKAFVNKEFKMKDLGEASSCLGIRITRDDKAEILCLDQEKYTRTLLERFNMSDCHPVNSPVNPDVKLSKSMSPVTEKEKSEMQSVPYLEAVGCLTYLSCTTRPDIAHAVNTVSQFSSCYGSQHWTAVKRIFRYLKQTVQHKLIYSRTTCDHIVGYTDADWGGHETRRSTTGYVFINNNGPISWKSKLQRSVSLSSCEAELHALVETVQEAVWLRRLQQEVRKMEFPIMVKCDNQSAISLVKNGNCNARTKHIDVRFKFVTEKLQDGHIQLEYINTKDQPADGLTKPLGPLKQKLHCSLIGIQSSGFRVSD